MTRLIGAIIAVLMLAVAAAPTALAAWSATGSGPAASASATMPAGAPPAASASGSSVSVRWAAVALSSGAPVGGYVVQRINAVNGSAATVGAGCSGIITTTTCTESSVPSGTWIYTDTPVLQSWTGAASPPSAPVTVP